MERELKFRLRLKCKIERFLHVTRGNITTVIAPLNELLCKSPTFLMLPFFEILSKDEFIGIQDTEGNDIYEGDIVEIGNGIGEDFTEVIYDNSICGFVFKGVYSSYYYEDIKNWTKIIIGNIHENPELIN